MNFFNIIMIVIGIGIGMIFQRFFHVLEDSSTPPPPAVKPKTKRSLREITSSPSQKLSTTSATSTAAKKAQLSDRSDRKKKAAAGTIKDKKVSKSASPALSPAIRPSKTSQQNSGISSPADVSMSNISPQNSMAETSMGTTQDITITKVEKAVVDPLANVLGDLSTKIEKLVSPRRAVIRPSQVICDCGVECMDEKEKYSEETTMPNPKSPITFTNKTKILPMTYDRYRPLNLIHPPEGPTQLSPFVTMKPDTKEETTLLTPFRPILHSMYYAHRHALLIGDLLENYDHLED